MRRVDGFVGIDSFPKKEENLKDVFANVLQTMVLLGKPFGINYVVKIVTGDQKNYWRHDSHMTLETFGKIKNRDADGVAYAIHLMIERRFIEAKKPDCNVIEITALGQNWLHSPADVKVWNTESRFDNLEIILRRTLRTTRQEIAAQRNLGAWEVFNDYTLDRIVIEKPTNLDALKAIPGMGISRSESMGSEILKAVHNVMTNFYDIQTASWAKMVRDFKCQRIKSLFEASVTIPEIAHNMGIQIRSVCYYLRVMHVMEEIDLVPWVEKNVNPKKLHACIEYFEKVLGANPQEAYNTLDMEWETVLFCHLYVAETARRKEERLSA
jgi:hypothetical protein